MPLVARKAGKAGGHVQRYHTEEMMKQIWIAMGLAAVLLCGCTAGMHRDAVRDDTKDRISVATVQREIKVGMSGADVVAVLGSPNMVTTDSERREIWVYDKVATERVYSTSEGGLGLLLGGAGSAMLGGGVGGAGQSSGAASTTQRTLTIIIKFDHDNTVRDFSYRQSSF